MASEELTLREVCLADAYEEHIERLNARIKELEAIREDPDYHGAIARRYVWHFAGKFDDMEWTLEKTDYLRKLFCGAITEALERYEKNRRDG